MDGLGELEALEFVDLDDTRVNDVRPLATGKSVRSLAEVRGKSERREERRKEEIYLYY